MNLQEIKSELRKLSELVGDWSERRPVPPLERDLVLEKLRAVYEALRFGIESSAGGAAKRALPAAAAAEPPAPSRFRRPGRFETEDPDIEVVDLSEVLSLDEPAESAEPAEAEKPSGLAAAAAASVGFSAPAAQPTVQPAARSAADSASPVAPEPVDDGPEIIEFVPDSEPAPAPRVAPAASRCETSVSDPAAHEEPAADSAPDAESVAATDAMPASVVERPQPEAESRSEKPSRPEEKPSSGQSRSLFGPDEEAVRHRHKQRVIMSLYDNDPRPAPESAAPGRPEPTVPQTPVSGRRNAADDEPEIVLLDASSEEPVGTAAEPEEEGPEIVVLDDEAAAPAPAASVHAARPVETSAAAAHRPAAALSEEPQAPVLGEVINHDVRTLGETIAAPRKSYGAPIADLRQAIGINDKFLMIRDLFGGNSVLFDATITALNAQQSLDDCMIYIAEHFAWNPDSESARLIVELLERKFA